MTVVQIDFEGKNKHSIKVDTSGFAGVDWTKRQKQLELSKLYSGPSYFDVPTIYLKPATKQPVGGDDSWIDVGVGDEPICTVIDEIPIKYINYGFAPRGDVVILDLDGFDAELRAIFTKVCARLGIDLRFGFGRESSGAPDHFILKVSGDLNLISAYALPAMRDTNGKFFAMVEIFYKPPTATQTKNSSNAPAPKNRQTVMPGSLYNAKNPTAFDTCSKDLSVWYGPKAATTPSAIPVETLIQAVAWTYIIREMLNHWTQQFRQKTGAIPFAGFLARMVSDAEGISNEVEVSALKDNVLTNISHDDHVRGIFEILCDVAEDDEFPMRYRAYTDARKHVLRGNLSSVPGRTAFGTATSQRTLTAITAWAMPGTNMNALYGALDRFPVLRGREEVTYADMRSFHNHCKYELSEKLMKDELAGQTIMLGGKYHALSKILVNSQMRTRLDASMLLPNYPPGAVLSMRRGKVLPHNYEGRTDRITSVLNSFSGFPYEPVQHPNAERGAFLEKLLRNILGVITRDEPKHVNKILSYIADMIQRPGDLLVLCMIFFGEKRVGKSTIANIFIPALVGEPMSGTITDTALDKPFYFDSYKGKLHVSVNDVVSLTSVAKGHLGNTTKDAKIYGEGKYDKGATFHNVCRNTVTTNVERINISLDGAFDPATFHVRTHTNMSLGMTPEEFEVWRSGLRKLYFDDFYAAMDDEDDMNHYMWFFKNFEYTREELLDTSYSAYNDPEMARHNAPYPVLALAELIKNGTFGNGSITNPFTSRCMKDELDSINRIVSKFPVTADDVIRAIEHIQITVSRGEHYIPTVYFGTMLERFESYYKFNPSPNHKNAVEIAEERALGKDSTYFGCIDPATVILPAPKKHKF